MNIAIIGSRGIPAKYGGFETFVEKLSLGLRQKGHRIKVYCSSLYADNRSKIYSGVEKVVIPSIPIKSLEKISTSSFSVFHNLLGNEDIILFLGVSPVIIAFLPRLFGKKIVINIDGLEWKRTKWNKIASFYLKLSEKLAGKLCNLVVTDSLEIQNYYYEKYKKRTVYIPYGADIIEDSNMSIPKKYGLEKRKYILQVCRLEPENNAHIVVREFSKIETDLDLVILGDNRYNTKYIKFLENFKSPKIKFLGAIYGKDYISILKNAFCYIHGHEVGGTNPALLEAMGAGNGVLVLNVPYNLEVIQDAGISFSKEEGELANKLKDLIQNPSKLAELKEKALKRIKEAYNWKKVIDDYESVFFRVLNDDVNFNK